jgi:hypothetical protein
VEYQPGAALRESLRGHLKHRHGGPVWAVGDTSADALMRGVTHLSEPRPIGKPISASMASCILGSAPIAGFKGVEAMANECRCRRTTRPEGEIWLRQ